MQIIDYIKKRKSGAAPLADDRYITPLFLWSENQMKLERYFRRMTKTNSDEAIATIGNAIYYIDQFNNSINNRLFALYEKMQKNKNEAQEDIKNLYLYSLFHNNIIIAKVKHFFFREVPNKSANNQFYSSELPVYFLGKEIHSLITNIENNKSYDTGKAKFIFCKYYYNLSLLYEFIYNKDKNEGIFLDFSYNDTIYRYTKSVFLKLFPTDSKDDEKSIRWAIHQLTPSLLDYYIGMDTSKWPQKKRYSHYVIKKINTTLRHSEIEPLSWRLSILLWYLDGQLQDAQEYIVDCTAQRTNIAPSVTSNIVKSLKNFVTSYLDFIDKSYKDGQIDYSTLFDTEVGFINLIWSIDDKTEYALVKFRKQKTISDLIKEFETTIKEHIADPIGIPTQLKCNHSINNIHDFITQKADLSSIKNEPIFKIHRLLENTNLTGDDLYYIFYSFSENVIKYCGQHDFSLIGFSVSGMVLSHLYNLIRGSLDQQVWYFRFFPFVSIHPNHLHYDGCCPSIQGCGKNQTIKENYVVALDEASKTKFTSAIYLSHLKTSHPNWSFQLFTLFSDTQTRKINATHDVWTLFTYENNKLVPHHTNNISNKNPDIYKAPLVEQLAPDKALQILRAVFQNKNDNRLDTNLLLTNSKFVISRCLYFAQQIYDYTKERNHNHVFLYSPSAEGKIFSYITVFIYRAYKEYSHKITWILSKKSFNELPQNTYSCTKVHLDICQFTGFTLANSLSNFLDAALVEDQTGVTITDTNKIPHSINQIGLDKQSLNAYFDLNLFVVEK